MRKTSRSPIFIAAISLVVICLLCLVQAATLQVNREKVVRKRQRVIQVQPQYVGVALDIPTVSGKVYKPTGADASLLTGACANVTVTLYKVTTSAPPPSNDPNDLGLATSTYTVISKTVAGGSLASGCDYKLQAKYNTNMMVGAVYNGPAANNITLPPVSAGSNEFKLSSGQSLVQKLTLSILWPPS